MSDSDFRIEDVTDQFIGVPVHTITLSDGIPMVVVAEVVATMEGNGYALMEQRYEENDYLVLEHRLLFVKRRK